MKKIVSQSEVAHFWANKTQSEATSPNRTFYFIGDTIYSYGRHFAIAKHVANRIGEKAIFFTCRGYSNTTSKHISIASRASSHLKSITVPYPDSEPESNFNYWLSAIKVLGNSLQKARKPGIYLNQIIELYGQAKEYAAFLEIEVPAELVNAGSAENRDDFLEAMKKEAEILAERQRKEAVDAANRFKKSLAKWREFDTQSSYVNSNRTGYDYLRFNKKTNTVETSQGVQIPAQIAKQFYKVVLDTIFHGGCDNCNMRLMDHYSVTQINKQFVRVGCHTITIKEIKSLTKKLGW